MKIERSSTNGGSAGTKTLKTTTNEILQIIDTVPIGTSEAVRITVDVVAIKNDASEQGGFLKEAIFANNAGTVTKQGRTKNLFHNAKDTWGVSFVINGTSVDVKVNGAIGDTVDWKCIRNINSV